MSYLYLTFTLYNILACFSSYIYATRLDVDVSPPSLPHKKFTEPEQHWHTHATLLIEHAADMKDVQTRLDHTNTKTTLQTYVHDTENMVEFSVELFEQMTRAKTSLNTRKAPNPAKFQRIQCFSCVQ